MRCRQHITLKSSAPMKAGSFVNDDDYFKKYLELAARKQTVAQLMCNDLLDCEVIVPVIGPEHWTSTVAVRM